MISRVASSPDSRFVIDYCKLPPNFSRTRLSSQSGAPISFYATVKKVVGIQRKAPILSDCLVCLPNVWVWPSAIEYQTEWMIFFLLYTHLQRIRQIWRDWTPFEKHTYRYISVVSLFHFGPVFRENSIYRLSGKLCCLPPTTQWSYKAVFQNQVSWFVMCASIEWKCTKGSFLPLTPSLKTCTKMFRLCKSWWKIERVKIY